MMRLRAKPTKYIELFAGRAVVRCGAVISTISIGADVPVRIRFVRGHHGKVVY